MTKYLNLQTGGGTGGFGFNNNTNNIIINNNNNTNTNYNTTNNNKSPTTFTISSGIVQIIPYSKDRFLCLHNDCKVRLWDA